MSEVEQSTEKTAADGKDADKAKEPPKDPAAKKVDEDTADEAAAVDPLVQAQAEAAENFDRYLRVSAELENFRKRTARMRQESREDTLRDVLLQLAPVIDNLRRALAQDVADAAGLKEGLGLVLNQFQDVFKSNGLEEIEAVGQPFDPAFHEAMLEMETEDQAPGTVVEEMEKGYRLRDKVIRPARVVVSKAPTQDQ